MLIRDSATAQASGDGPERERDAVGALRGGRHGHGDQRRRWRLPSSVADAGAERETGRACWAADVVTGTRWIAASFASADLAVVADYWGADAGDLTAADVAVSLREAHPCSGGSAGTAGLWSAAGRTAADLAVGAADHAVFGRAAVFFSTTGWRGDAGPSDTG